MPATRSTACTDPRSVERGFTLLEAIVAVALLGVALVPILTLLSQSAAQLVAAGDANTRSFVRLSALEFMEAVNPMTVPEGSSDLGSVTIAWESEAIVAPVPPAARSAGLRGYELGWFNVEVTLLNSDGVVFDQMRLQKTGYRRVNQRNPFNSALQ